MLIDINKTYKTRNGFPVKLTRVNEKYAYGYIKTPAYGMAETSWYSNGDFKDDFEESPLDLIEVTEDENE